MISGIGWVSELVEVAGGSDIFADRASCQLAKDRIVTAEEVIHHSPDVIIGSWCGKKFRPEKVAQRPGFDCVPAVKLRRRLTRDQIVADSPAGTGGRLRR